MTEVLQGLQELERKLKKLGDLEQRKALNKGMNAGGKILLAKARENAKKHDNPKTPNKIWRNVALRRWKQRKGRKYLGLSVGVRSDGTGGNMRPANKDGKSYAPYWMYLEFGNARQAAKPFLGPALTEIEAAATQAIAQGAIQAIKDSAK